MTNETPAKDYLAEYDAAPEERKYPLVYGWMKTEPLPFFEQLRKQRPVLVTPECTLVARWDDITDILDMPLIFTVALYLPKMSDGYLMSHDEDALHYREKSIMQGFLNKDDLPEVRRRIAEAGKKVLDEAGGQIEACYGYCRTVPCMLVQDYFGLTGVEREDLIRWSYWSQYNTFHNQPFDLVSKEKSDQIIAEHAKTSKELVEYITMLIARRLFAVKVEKAANILFAGWYALEKIYRKIIGKQDEELGDDITSRMLRTSYPDAMDFGLKRVAANAGGLLIGSIETTEQAVAQVIQFLMEDPERFETARTEALKEDTAAFDALVWEALRFVPISPYMFRTAAEDFTIGKGTDHATLIPKDTNVLLLTQSGMFDERAYDQPDAFNPDRDWYHNFNFGFGSHDCLGKYVGAEMIPEMVRQVMRRPGLEADGKIDYKDGPFPEHWILRYKN